MLVQNILSVGAYHKTSSVTYLSAHFEMLYHIIIKMTQFCQAEQELLISISWERIWN